MDGKAGVGSAILSRTWPWLRECHQLRHSQELGLPVLVFRLEGGSQQSFATICMQALGIDHRDL